MSWFFPWDIFKIESSISISYIFDIIFVTVILAILKKRNLVGRLDIKGFSVRLLATLSIAILCVGLTKIIPLNAPFKYIEFLFIQILILAPIIEELVFRAAIFEICENAKLNKQVTVLFNAILFSISHIPALWFLPVEFHSFIGFQLFYTLILGWVCAKSRLKTGGVVEPMLLHFVFNLVFYISIKFYAL
jgi:membrane protease YdiL (CAAX protease family)